MKSRSLATLLVALGATALLVSTGGAATATRGAASRAASLSLPVATSGFGVYKPVAMIGPDAPAYAGPATPHSLAKVQIPLMIKRELKLVPKLGPMLAKQGFAVVPSGSSLFQTEYEGNIYGGFALYVTTDAAYNAWHLAFDKILRDLEQQQLLPQLDKLVTGLVAYTGKQAAALQGTSLAADAAKAQQIYELAAAELGLPVKLGPLAAKEKALVDHHSATVMSPILGTKLDYSLFTPRGHYTLTKQLTQFFVAMSVLEQYGFCVPGSQSCSTLDPARIGLLASTAFASTGGSSSIVSLWHDIYDPTSFMVGLSDDYTPSELMTAVSAADPSWGGKATAFESDTTVQAIMKQLTTTRAVQIDPQRAAVRVMGTRFTTDEFLLGQLVSPNVGTTSKPRLVPSGLDVGAMFGSPAATKALAANGGSGYANYDTQLAAVQKAIAARPAAAWGDTVDDAWLAALQPVFAPHGKSFPDYMRTEAWSAKDLQSGLGSYAELKHDTILFAKQLTAEAGGDFVKANPQNWVEPDPVAFERLGSAADLLRKGLAKRGLLSAKAKGLLQTEVSLFGFLGRIATGELRNKPIAAADNKRLRSVGDALSAIWFQTSEQTNPDPSLPDQSAIVADIASGPKGVVTLATGQVDTIYVIVPVATGGFEIARGGAYSYYEFTTPPGQRLTDEEWRAELQKKPAPKRPSWESVFRVPCAHGAQVCSPSYLPG